MAIPIPVKDLLLARRVESTRIEYKANWSLEENGSPEPIFLTNEDRTYFTIVPPVHPAFRKGSSADMSPGNNTLNDTLKGVDLKVQRAVAQNPGINRPQLCELLSISESTVARCIRTLSDRIEYRGSKKTGGYYALRSGQKGGLK